MTGTTELDKLLGSISPKLIEGDFVFCTVPGELAQYLTLNPVATFIESEGLTLVLPKHKAEEAGLPFESVFRQITLTVHSSLEAVGLTAAVSTKLASKGISANMIAAYYHDHVFVQKEKAESAFLGLQEFSR